jgi:hypothetical protein
VDSAASVSKKGRAADTVMTDTGMTKKAGYQTTIVASWGVVAAKEINQLLRCAQEMGRTRRRRRKLLQS